MPRHLAVERCDWTDAIVVIEIPRASQSLHYRAYAQPLDGASVLSWGVARLRAMTDADVSIVIAVDRFDAARVRGALEPATGVSVWTGNSPGEIVDALMLLREVRARRGVFLDLSAALLPPGLLGAVLNDHLSRQAGATIVERMPCALAPVIVEADLLTRLKEAPPAGLSTDLRLALATIERVSTTTGMLTDLRVERAAPVSERLQDRRRWPHATRLETPEDVETLTATLHLTRTADGPADLLPMWTSALEQAWHRRLGTLRRRARTGAPPGSRVERLLWISTPSAFSGAEQVLAQLDQALARHPDWSWTRFALVAHPGTLTDRLAATGARTLIPQRNFALSSVENLSYAQDVLREVRPSIVHANSVIGVPLTFALMDQGIPLVQHVHIGNARLPELEEQLQCASAVIAVSAYVKERVVRYGVAPERVHVVYNGMHVEADYEPDASVRQRIRRAFDIDDTTAVVLMVARFHPAKRHDVLIDAVARLVRGGRPVRVLLVGEVFQESQVFDGVRKHVARVGLHEHVRFLGFQDDIQSICAASDVLVLPAENDSFPQTVLEAMAYKLPVLAVRSGGVPEMIADGETGVLVEPGDAEALGAALDDLLSDGPRRHRLIANAFEGCLSQFSDTRQVQQVLHVYRDVLQGDHEAARR